jgi:hypothetical protein
MEVIMDVLVSVVKPLILKLATHPAVKNLVIELLEKYVKTTDNSIDDMILVTVKELLFKPQTEV